MELIVSAPPFIKKEVSSEKIVLDVIAGLALPAVASIFLFNTRAFLIIVTTVTSAVVTEAAVQKFASKKITINDGTAIITGLILALLMPGTVPLWIPPLGAVFAIAIIKQAFGGNGNNIFNPALGGWVFLMLSWSAYTVTMPSIPANFANIFINPLAIKLVESSPLAVFIGGMYLLVRRDIKVMDTLGFVLVHLLFVLLEGSLHYISTGMFALFLFFVITDPVTTPITKSGRLLFGAGAGVLSIIYSLYGNYEEGLGLAVLLMNALTPLIDRATRPKPLEVI